MEVTQSYGMGAKQGSDQGGGPMGVRAAATRDSDCLEMEEFLDELSYDPTLVEENDV